MRTPDEIYREIKALEGEPTAPYAGGGTLEERLASTTAYVDAIRAHRATLAARWSELYGAAMYHGADEWAVEAAREAWMAAVLNQRLGDLVSA